MRKFENNTKFFRDFILEKTSSLKILILISETKSYRMMNHNQVI